MLELERVRGVSGLMSDRHTQLFHLVSAHLRDPLKVAYLRERVALLPYEEASYWLSKADTTRGQRAFRMLMGAEK
jgi:hypothetical protein